MRLYSRILSILAVFFLYPLYAAPLKSIHEVRNLDVESASQGLAVDFESQIVWMDPVRVGCFIYDGKHGIYVRGKRPYPEKVMHSLKPGDIIRIQGITSAGEFTPSIVDADITFLKRAVLPPAKVYDDNFLLSPLLDCEWISLNGQIVSIASYTKHVVDDYIIVELAKNNYIFNIQVPYSKESETQLRASLFKWASVNVVAVTTANRKRQFTDRYFYANSLKDFSFTEPLSLGETSSLELTPKQFMQRNMNHLTNVKSYGTITHITNRAIYLRGKDSNTKVYTTGVHDYSVGDYVSIEGYVTAAPISPSFRARECKIIKKNNPPKPIFIDISEEIDTNQNYDLVSLEAVLLDIIEPNLSQTAPLNSLNQTILLCRAGERLFEARLPTGFVLTNQPPLNSTLNLTGIYQMSRNLDSPWQFEIADVWVELRSANDIQVIVRPPWWTPERINWLARAAIIIASLFFIWVVLLRSTINRQTKIISNKIKQETVLHERQRMARELHDNLDQGLTGAAIQLQSSRKFIDTQSQKHLQDLEKALDSVEELEVTDQLKHLNEEFKEAFKKYQSSLNSVQNILSHCGEEARTAIFELRGGLLEKMELPQAIEETIKQLTNEYDIETHIHVNNYRNIRYRAERNLLMIIREAAANAIKHASPKKIDIHLKYEDDLLTILIEDNGYNSKQQAIEKPGHFGIVGMKERIQRLGGSLNIQGPNESGTKVTILLPSLKKWEIKTS